MEKYIILAKKQEDGLLDMHQCSLKKQGALITQLRDSGFLDFVGAEQQQCDDDSQVVEHLNIIDGKLVQSWEVVPTETKL